MKNLFVYILFFPVNLLIAQFPPPTNFQFSYEYIMIDEWSECLGSTVYGPAYCSHFTWNQPDLPTTDATLTGYNLYIDDVLYISVSDTFYDAQEGFIGRFYVTANYSNPSGESDTSNNVINSDLPISIQNTNSENSSLILYQNDLKQILIHKPEYIKELIIIDVEGKEIYYNKNLTPIIKVNTLEAGTYFVTLLTKDDYIEVKKIVIQ